MIQDTVTNIQLDHTNKGNYNLNQVTFKSGYVAFEKAQLNGGSRFTLNQCCFYKITNAGYNGKADWIEFVKSCESDKYDMASEHMRSYAIIMQNALTNAVTFYTNIRKPEELSESDVIETAIFFAKGVVTGAQELARMAEAPAAKDTDTFEPPSHLMNVDIVNH